MIGTSVVQHHLPGARESLQRNPPFFQNPSGLHRKVAHLIAWSNFCVYNSGSIFQNNTPFYLRLIQEPLVAHHLHQMKGPLWVYYLLVKSITNDELHPGCFIKVRTNETNLLDIHILGLYFIIYFITQNIFHEFNWRWTLDRSLMHAKICMYI